MSTYLAQVKKMQLEFEYFSIEQLLRSENINVDALANLGSLISSEYRRTISVEILAHPSILGVKEVYNTNKVERT